MIQPALELVSVIGTVHDLLHGGITWSILTGACSQFLPVPCVCFLLVADMMLLLQHSNCFLSDLTCMYGKLFKCEVIRIDRYACQSEWGKCK